MKALCTTTLAMLLSILLASHAQAQLSFEPFEDPPHEEAQNEPQAVWILVGCVVVVTVVVAGVAVYVVYEAQQCSERERCEECGKIVEDEDGNVPDTCPRCFTDIPHPQAQNEPDSFHNVYNPTAFSFTTELQYSTDMGLTWMPYPLHNGAGEFPTTYYNTDVEVKAFSSQAQFDSWFTGNPNALSVEVVTTNVPSSLFVRYAETDL